MAEGLERQFVEMCNLSRGVIEKGVEKGMAASIGSLMRKLKMTAGQAVDALSISESEQPKYKALIKIVNSRSKSRISGEHSIGRDIPRFLSVGEGHYDISFLSGRRLSGVCRGNFKISSVVSGLLIFTVFTFTAGAWTKTTGLRQGGCDMRISVCLCKKQQYEIARRMPGNPGNITKNQHIRRYAGMIKILFVCHGRIYCSE